jgi:hypothetical protein
MLPVVIIPGNLKRSSPFRPEKQPDFSFIGGIEAILADKADVRH